MWGKKTKAVAKDGRLTIMTDNARQPGVVSLALDQVQSGQFETTNGENGGIALVFKPGGKKAPETLAVYDSGDKAADALRCVYKALSGSAKGKGGVLKVVGLIALVIVVLWLLASVVLSWLIGDATSQMNVSDMAATVGSAPAAPAAAPTQAKLPVGEPFPASHYIEATKDDTDMQGQE